MQDLEEMDILDDFMANFDSTITNHYHFGTAALMMTDTTIA